MSLHTDLARRSIQAATGAKPWGLGDKAMIETVPAHPDNLIAQHVPACTVDNDRQAGIAIENALNSEEAMQNRDKETKQRLYLKKEIRAEFGEIVGESPAEQVKNEATFNGIIGSSSALKFVLADVERVAPTDSTVLVLGETGTGKELIARAIHNISPRCGRPFVKLNCAAIPFDLLESELFGHEKGAFTGAVAQRIGRFEMADTGTLFLDEIGDLPLALQPKLLRILQEQEFERLGSGRTHQTNVRLVAATNCDLAEMVARNEFRSDLYYRLNVVPVLVPPLRERREDIRRLVQHFVEVFARRMQKRVEEIPQTT